MARSVGAPQRLRNDGKITEAGEFEVQWLLILSQNLGSRYLLSHPPPLFLLSATKL